MRFHVERLECASVLIAESDLGQFARMITDSEFKTAHEPAWLFWSSVLDLRYAALGESKSQADIYELLRGLK